MRTVLLVVVSIVTHNPPEEGPEKGAEPTLPPDAVVDAIGICCHLFTFSLAFECSDARAYSPIAP